MCKPLVATVLVSAVAGTVITALAPAAAAASLDGSITNRGWASSAPSRGSDNGERASSSQDSD
jgi:hypothetical protein